MGKVIGCHQIGLNFVVTKNYDYWLIYANCFVIQKPNLKLQEKYTKLNLIAGIFIAHILIPWHGSELRNS